MSIFVVENKFILSSYSASSSVVRHKRLRHMSAIGLNIYSKQRLLRDQNMRFLFYFVLFC